jgi:hypothetical protein
MIASTVCLVVVGGVATIVVVEILHPQTSTDAAVASINDIVNTLIGLLAGFLAGRTDLNLAETKVQHPVLGDPPRTTGGPRP